MSHMFVWTFSDLVWLTVLGLVVLVVIAVVAREVLRDCSKRIRDYFDHR